MDFFPKIKTLLLSLTAVFLAVNLQAAVPQVDQASVGRALQAQARHSDALMAVEGIEGTAVAIAGDGKAVVQVLLAHGAVSGFPATVDGVPVQPFVSGKIYARPRPAGVGPDRNNDEESCSNDPTLRFPRPVPIGVSTGHPAITAGTLGVRVTDGSEVYALSNNHVFANENKAQLGESVIQPGTFDGGSSPADDIGVLGKFEPIVFSTEAANEMDAALALTSTAEVGKQTPCYGYGLPKSQPLEAVLNMKVKKCGRTTGCTSGSIGGINATVDVRYDTGVARFVGQLLIQPGSFSAGGDSGSLVVADGKGRDKSLDRRPVALLFAGSQTVTIATPISLVLDRFAVTIDGE